MKDATLILCLMAIAIPVHVLFFLKPSASVPSLEWLKPVNHVFLVILYAMLGIWALIDLRTAQIRVRRTLLKSIIIDIGAIWTIDISIWMNPDFGEVLRPIITILAYLLALLVVCAFQIESQTRGSPSGRGDLKAKRDFDSSHAIGRKRGGGKALVRLLKNKDHLGAVARCPPRALRLMRPSRHSKLLNRG